MSTLGRLFGKSPFGPLQEHMVVVKKCVDQVIPFFEAEIKGDKKKAEEITQKIFDLEQKADTIKNTLRDNLPRSLFMPVDRHSLLVILDFQDSIADTAQDISIIFTLRPITIPSQIVDGLRKFIDSSVKACYLAAEISERYDELLDSSFTGAEAERVLGMVNELNTLERENDEAGLNLTRNIFSLEDVLSPVEIFLWSKINSLIGDLADYSLKMANRMRLILAK